VSNVTAKTSERHAAAWRVAVTGSTGLVGSALVRHLTDGGHEVIRLVRDGSTGGAGRLTWDPGTGTIDPGALDDVDAVVHLAGENIAAGRWTPARKDRILRSRVDGTRRLSEALARSARPPRALVCASAIGFYGDRGEEVLTESSGPGQGFLAEVCRHWETAAEPARRAGIRVVSLRLGMILSGRGGALAKMLPLYRLGLGGRIGHGRQYLSWVTLTDTVRAIEHAVRTDLLRGPANVVAPRPATNRAFTAMLARVLQRPAVLPVPAWVLRLALGEMADALLLAGARVEPMMLLATGFRFVHDELENALRAELG